MLLSPKLKDLIQSFDKYKQNQPPKENSLPGSPTYIQEAGTAVTSGVDKIKEIHMDQPGKGILRHRVLPPQEQNESGNLAPPSTQPAESNYPISGNANILQNNPSMNAGQLPPVGDEVSEASTQNTQKLKIRMTRPDKGVF